MEQKLVERDEITYKEHLRKLDQIKQQENAWDDAREKDIEELENLLASVPNNIDDQIERFNKAESIKIEITSISNSLRMLKRLYEHYTSVVTSPTQVMSLKLPFVPLAINYQQMEFMEDIS